MVFSGVQVHGCFFDDVAAVLVRERGLVVRPLVSFDFGDQRGSYDRA